MEQGCQQPRPRAAQRMANGDRPAVDVDDLRDRLPGLRSLPATGWQRLHSAPPDRYRSSASRPAARPSSSPGQAPRPSPAAARRQTQRRQMRANGLRFNSLAFSALITSRAAAPSFKPDELPAVTVPPSFANAGFKFCQRLQRRIAARAFIRIHHLWVALFLAGRRPPERSPP